MTPQVVPGALEGAQELQNMGYELVIVTARHLEEESRTRLWLKTHFPGNPAGNCFSDCLFNLTLFIPDIFSDVICTGQFMKDEDGKQTFGKKSKSEVRSSRVHPWRFAITGCRFATG